MQRVCGWVVYIPFIPFGVGFFYIDLRCFPAFSILCMILIVSSVSGDILKYQALQKKIYMVHLGIWEMGKEIVFSYEYKKKSHPYN